MPASEPIVEFFEGQNARIEINVAEKAEKPISPYLFGEFTEHLGSNVYGGAWAQLLDNTGFELAKYFSWEEDAGVERALARSEEYDLLGSYKAGVACFWGRWGKGDVTYSPSDDRVNSDQAQRIEIRSLQSPEVGLLQPITLPTHRTGKYEISLWAKGTVGKPHIAIRTTDGTEIRSGANGSSSTPASRSTGRGSRSSRSCSSPSGRGLLARSCSTSVSSSPPTR